jgi:hypothetical protein
MLFTASQSIPNVKHHTVLRKIHCPSHHVITRDKKVDDMDVYVHVNKRERTVASSRESFLKFRVCLLISGCIGMGRYLQESFYLSLISFSLRTSHPESVLNTQIALESLTTKRRTEKITRPIASLGSVSLKDWYAYLYGTGLPLSPTL